MRGLAAALVLALPLAGLGQANAPGASQEEPQPPPPPETSSTPPPEGTPPTEAPPPGYVPRPSGRGPRPPRHVHPGRMWASPPRMRGPWYIGFGVGWGTGSYVVNGATVSFADHVAPFGALGFSLNFKVGATLSPQLLLGFDFTGVATSGRGAGVDRTIAVGNYVAMLTWFPMERGFFLRGGTGLATLSWSDSLYGATRSSGRGGLGVVGGLGYAFWLGWSFNLTLNLDVSAQFYGSRTNEPSRSGAVSLFMGFDWY